MAYTSPWRFKNNDRISNFIINMKNNKREVFPVATVPVKEGVDLYQHQVKAYNIMLAIYGYLDKSLPPVGGSGAALFMEMGTGKSLSAIAVSGRLFLDKRIKRVLIVAPSSVCSVWDGEYKKFAGFPYKLSVLLGTKEKRIQSIKSLVLPSKDSKEELLVAVINYESTWRLEEELKSFKPDMIICDESQRIKGQSTKQSKAMHRLGKIANYRCILTGTPIQNDVRDVWSQYRFLDPTIFPNRYNDFVSRYIEMKFNSSLGYEYYSNINKKTADELKKKIHSIAYRITKKECLDLPPKMFSDRVVTLESSTRKIYKNLQDDLCSELRNGERVTVESFITSLLRLQQITGGFIKDDSGNIQQVSTAKMDALEDIIETYCIDEEKKIVVFTRFLAEYEAIQQMISQLFKKTGNAHLQQVSICGSTPVTARESIINQFQTDQNTRVFVGQIDACAEGITLNAATTTVYYSVNWNYAKYQQSQDRTHRIGVSGSCMYINLIVENTIDQKVIAALKNKEDISISIVDKWRTFFAD